MTQSGDSIGLPELPSKRNEHGNKKSGEELQVELEQYINDLIQIPVVARMFQTKLFFGANQYTDMEEEGTPEKVEIG